MNAKKRLFVSIFSALAVVVFLTPAAMAETQTIDGDIFKVVIKTEGGKATITVTPKTVNGVNHHCNQEFPWKLEIKGEEGVTSDQAKYEAPFKAASGTIHTPSHTKVFSLEKVVYEVTYTIPAGKVVKAKLTFSVCDDKQCYRKTQNLEWK